MKQNNIAKNSSIYISLLFILPCIIFPFYWMFITSLKSRDELFSKILTYWPQSPVFESYDILFREMNFLRNMSNSLSIAICTVILSLGVSVLASYAFARYKFHGKAIFLCVFLMINMFPTVLLLIPLYSTMFKVGLLGTRLSVVMAHATIAIPFSILLLTAYLNDIPIELEEAAMIDGCSRFGAFLRIIMPVIVPGIIATGTYVFITSWNEFTYAVMFTNEETRTIPVAFQALVGQFDIRWDVLTAGGTITIIPILIVFFMVQKKLVEGLTAGAVKG